MDFSLPQLFVLKASNTLPSGTNWSALTSQNFGIYKPDYTAATAANVASQAYIQLVQARPITLPGVGHKRTDKIYLKNVIEWYKVTGSATGTAQVTYINPTETALHCGEDVTISLRLHSFYINAGFFNGLTRSYTYNSFPCCSCGSSPCDTVLAADVEAMVDWFVAAINGDTGKQGAGNYVTAAKVGSGLTSSISLTGKTLAAEPTTADRTNFPYQYDRVYFWTWAYKGPALSQDYTVFDKCDPFADVDQFGKHTDQTTGSSIRATYAYGTSSEIKQLEVDYNSYNTAPIAKQIFKNINFNQGVQATEVVDGTTYDMYYIKYKNPTKDTNWNAIIPQDESAIICNPTGQNTSTIAVLTAFLGTPTDKSA
jgi:hypothetical protein